MVINSCFSFEECETKTWNFEPDILFIGTAKQGGETMEQLRLMRQRLPNSTIIFFTEYGIDEYRQKAIMEGANYVMSKELWTGGEILALVKTILQMKNYQDTEGIEQRLLEEDILRQPIERRRKDRWGIASEQNYLAHNASRRIQK